MRKRGYIDEIVKEEGREVIQIGHKGKGSHYLVKEITESVRQESSYMGSHYKAST